ncbi:glycosyltransferase [Thalassovita aquimarina]|uniref:Glycosyltransferase n=1 Tax=Thalassovita aquimarina TaxID=2785917 RepID=A0ABS5HNM9_9RHOB|nr:glycosyltransferase [Thalassovita aquimarina]MBR9650565.1 glycosyltransferase [Thalassovita aquimarina]
MISIIIPANNEGPLIGACLTSLLASDMAEGGMEIVVVANGCSDDTADRARAFSQQVRAKGWGFEVIEMAEGCKLGALNAGDLVATGSSRAYLDADVTVSPDLMRQIAEALDTDAPRYASGQVRIPMPESGASRAYRAFYLTVPFMTDGVPGCGLFAMNAAGRARWDAFPDIISDDTFARLSFAPEERVLVPAPYDWPLVEGFGNLVKVRRRQNIGVAEIATKYPDLLRNDDKRRYGTGRLIATILRHPLGFAVYALVALVVKIGPNNSGWSRGR